MKNKFSIAMSLAVILAMIAATFALAAELVTAEVTGTTNDVTVVQGGAAVSSAVNVSATGAIASTITSGNPATAKIKTVYTLTGGVPSSSTLSSAMNFFSSGSGCAGNNCDVTWTGAPNPYSVSISVSADGLTPANNYTVQLCADNPDTTPTVECGASTVETNPSATGGKLGDTTPTNIIVHVRLAAPSGLSASGVSQTQIDLSWADNSTG